VSADLAGALLGALWLGVLTAVSPCPLATNIAAISYVSRKVGSARGILLSGLLYTAGRMLACAALGTLIVSSLLTSFRLSRALQGTLNVALGPLLLVAGLFLLDVLRFRGRGSGAGERLQRRVDRMGYGGSFLLGVVFAVSFCPVSAALFFGSLIPLALQHESRVLLPAVYGAATALPVLGFAALLSAGAAVLARVFARVQRWERHARRVTGAVFLLVGAYYTLLYVFKVRIW
jgi:cytochrome c-type biogenesis protein